ncbi:alpha-(1,3)-fucosyltransferase 7 [Genypterus blacodes]|uniref:alpha-(1,3)-fucosyltransferase 7 n=1 Tax=Genypterus blacodes TaxID=154954 RepID=UPI003F75A5E4
MKRFVLSSVLLLFLLGGWLREIQDLKAVTLSPFCHKNDIRQSAHRNVTVLLWHWPFGFPNSLDGDVCWDLYHIPRCHLVVQHSFYNTADVVVFHNRELVRGHQKLPLHLPRPPGQRWAWMSLESPEHNGNLQQYANIFNLTITFRRDADISIPYGELLPRRDGEDEQGSEVAAPQNKTALVCWVISNYRKRQKRSQVYKQLRAIIPVKLYGHWSRRPLSPKALLPTISNCYFYLAFENSVTKDYITEKLWRNSYGGGAVPIVLGASLSDYKAVAPPRSFIHVDEFATIKALGEHLKHLAEDKKRYDEYFRWKQLWRVKLLADWRERLCRVCSQYNTLPQYKVYADLEAWVSAPNSKWV